MRKVLALGSLASLLWIAGCGGSGSTSFSSGGGGAPNVAAISVNSGPTGQYSNGVFASVTFCVPGTATCQTVSNLLVDTGSFGVRVLASKLSLSGLPGENSGGSPLVECAQFASGFVWGPVKVADVKIAGESASNVPIQIIDDANSPQFMVPGSCSSGMTNESSLGKLLANGILGVGLAKQDCFPCTSVGQHFYFACSSASTCNEVGVPLAQQVQNPVWMFASDNNGVLVQLPSLASAAPSVNGSLIFGINTRSNNSLGSATPLTVDNSGNITTVFGKNNTSYPGFFDSGSNGIFFLDTATTGLPDCGGVNAGWYCPASPTMFNNTNKGTNNASRPGNFTIANANSLFGNVADSAFSQLGGNSGPPPLMIDFGLPFFFGQNVFFAIEQQPVSGTTGGPWYAY